jgi:hypothetical protein
MKTEGIEAPLAAGIEAFLDLSPRSRPNKKAPRTSATPSTPVLGPSPSRPSLEHHPHCATPATAA